ncbi:MAG: signal peptide peptidase SppA [Planctomycetaceae bacterium]|nr:signal peptide peptidase SppA [Planctomycetaceae bacterium]
MCRVEPSQPASPTLARESVRTMSTPRFVRRSAAIAMCALWFTCTALALVADEAPQAADKPEAAPAPPKRNTHLLSLRGSYADLPQSMGLDLASLLQGPVNQKPFYRLCEHLDQLATDKRQHYLVLDLSDQSLGMNMAQLDEFTRRIQRFKATGKKTIAWLEEASTVTLAIAVCCDEVVMADFGGLDMPSLAMQTIYYKDAMDLLGVQASVVRAGDFKGAVEPYTQPVMSGHLRTHYLQMLARINDGLVAKIAAGRGLEKQTVRKLQTQRTLLPTEALAAGLVDRLAPYGSLKKTLSENIPGDVVWSTPAQKPQRSVSIFDLLSSLMSGPKTAANARGAVIAVLHLSGNIVSGRSASAGAIVSGPTAQTIQSLIDDDAVKAVVVRINSPGGSATASEVIRSALEKLAQAKPTVISMGDTAASGGYWISCIGVPVYAETGTITGSIGVFSMKLSAGALLRRVGVRIESLTLDESAGLFALDRVWSDADKGALGKMIDDVYGRFLTLVSKARNLPEEKVRELAGGRVWSGSQARELGLIDHLGGVDTCLEFLAEKAKLDKYTIIHRPLASTGINLMELLGGSGEDEISSRLGVGQLRALAVRGLHLNRLRLLLKDAQQKGAGPPTIWALHPAEITIR